MADYFEYPLEAEKYDAALSFETLPSVNNVLFSEHIMYAKEKYQAVLKRKATSGEYATSLALLSKCLEAYHGRGG